MELSIGVVSGVGPGIHALDGGSRVLREGVDLGLCAPIVLQHIC